MCSFLLPLPPSREKPWPRCSNETSDYGHWIEGEGPMPGEDGAKTGHIVKWAKDQFVSRFPSGSAQWGRLAHAVESIRAYER